MTWKQRELMDLAHDSEPEAAPAADAASAVAAAAPSATEVVTRSSDSSAEDAGGIELPQTLEQVHQELNQHLKELAVLRKTLDGLRAKGALDRVDVLQDSLQRLQGAAPKIDFDALQQQLLAAVQSQERHRRAALRRELLQALHGRAKAENIAFELVTEQPLHLLLSPLGVSIDLATGRASLEYAREELLEVEAEAEAILEGRKKALEKLRKHASEPLLFFDQLVAAYRIALMMQGKHFGEPVDLVDLLLPLSVVGVEAKRWRALPLAKFPEFSRALLAYQLQRLRQQGCLERNKLRLDLGTATGGSTKDKRNVLFVPFSATEGQYYLSLRVHAL